MTALRKLTATTLALLVVGMLIPMPLAHAEEGGGFSDGRWRMEVAGGTGIHSGNRSRTNDLVITGNVEYEWPVFARTTLGLRAYPLFVYDQDEPEETLWGAGFGVVGRMYANKEELRGLFAEGGAAALFHSNEIEGNSANMNFLLEAGVGYQFKNDWHVTLQFQHISNAGLGEDNAGANSIGLAVGFTF